MLKLTRPFALLVVVALSIAVVYAAETKPSKTEGLTATKLHQFDIGAQIPQAKGLELRARRIVIAPGGHIAEHSHADRPGFVYVLEGSFTEHRGDVARVVHAGDTWQEDAGTVHWMENTSGKPAVIVAVDVVHKE